MHIYIFYIYFIYIYFDFLLVTYGRNPAVKKKDTKHSKKNLKYVTFGEFGIRKK